jgi:hypothetical protein
MQGRPVERYPTRQATKEPGPPGRERLRRRSAFYEYFHDLHKLRESLLEDLEQEILAVADPWFKV